MIRSQDEQELIRMLRSREGSMFDQARVMRELCVNYQHTQASLAGKLHVSQSYIGNKLRLLTLSASEQEKILAFGMSERHARALLRAKQPRRERLITTAGSMRLTVQETEELVEKYVNNGVDAVCNADHMQILQTPDGYLQSVQAGADRLRNCGYKILCLTEAGDGWRRIAVTIVDECFT